MSACTPSRINNEGHPEMLSPLAGNYGGGFGDWFAYRDLLESWLADGRLEGLELGARSPTPTP
jgi:cyclohexanone monooxygenase/pentalenolactone D synthase